jgi:hypothetical protein
MSLAFDAIEPVVYPVALNLFKNGMERCHIAGEIFEKFGKQYNVPENKLNTSMIDLSITCAEHDFNNSIQHGIAADRINWGKLNNMQIGKYAEYYTKMEFTLYGFEVFTSEVDDRGIDFIARDKQRNIFEIQVKSIRKLSYVFMQKEHFDITNKNLYLALLIFSESRIPEIFLIPSKVWEKPNALFVGRDYEKPGQISRPEWGLNISEKNMNILNKYKFREKIEQLM